MEWWTSNICIFFIKTEVQDLKVQGGKFTWKDVVSLENM